MKDVVIIPAYNEEKTISAVIIAAKKQVPEVIVVDDGSHDATGPVAQRCGARVVRHRVNMGKGSALKTGCDLATTLGAQRLVVIDADGQHDARHIPQFLRSLDEGYAVVFGCRTIPEAMPFVLRFGNRLISNLFMTLYQVRVEDTQCGYRAFTADAYKNIRWEARDYFVETEMLINAGRKKLKHRTIPIKTIYADKYKGTTVFDGVLIVLKMITARLLHVK
ncbi:MAG: glycosyltransferase family 2 protein [Nanoarchaeota archaeon]|nr:glycosyltransferase family 2 protein [Nanoarchaeota archaeon]